MVQAVLCATIPPQAGISSLPSSPNRLLATFEFYVPWIIEGGLEKLNLYAFSAQLGLLCGSEGKESACNSGDPGLIPGLGRFPDGREWLPTPVFLPGNSINRGAWRASVHGVTESDTTEQLTLSPFHFLLNYTISLG